MLRTFPGYFCALLLISSTTVAAQTPPAGTTEAVPTADEVTTQDPGPDTGTPDRIRVYLDCGGGASSCFPSYLREQIDFVDFVRQPQDADVHLLSSGQETGGGGREVVLRFVGRNAFEGHDHDLKAITGVGDTENTRREVILRTVLVGLLDYVAHDGIPAGVNISVQTEGEERITAVPDDPWNLWVFSVRFDGSIDKDERSSQREWQTNFSADRVTENWKLAFGGRYNTSTETFVLEDEPDFKVERSDKNVNAFVAKSLGPHWSAGLRGRMSTSTFNNNKLSASLRPAVEFSVFPYREYATRQFLIEYDVGPVRAEYEEETIFAKLKETLWQQTVEVSLDQRQPWGSLSAGFDFSQYLHDASKYQLEGNGNVNLRITRGLSLNFNGSASRVRDQLSLPAEGATDAEVLLRIRELQSGYRVRFRFGITYSFGSLFNNVVNPRFGGGGGGGRGGGGGGFF